MKQTTTSFSPPSLPSSPKEGTSPSPLTSHFVQALHDFLPSSGPADQSVSCLFFRKGAIIEVFNRDSSGWWDGLLNDVRGWFPSNYVGRIGDAVREAADFEDEHSQGELDAWRQTMNLITLDASQWEALMEDVSMRMSELVDACNAPAGIQVAVFQVVSSIRAVLTAANTVNKDSPLLRLSPELARQRKIVLNALSRLVLKGKELQAAPPKPVDGEMPSLANQLLIEMDMFEEVFRSLSGNYQQQQPEQPYHHNHHSLISLSPRNSLTSLSSTSTLSLRHQLASARLSSASLIAKAVPLPDANHIHENILEHRVEITTLIASLFLTIERYLATRQRATEMLEMTRKAVEAVRTFLAIVEHICSNIDDLDHKHSSSTPEDPHLVALVVAKEAVYSAITHLVTAVRALTGPHEDDEPLERLRNNCDNVVRTTNTCTACVRTCLHIDSVESVSEEDQEAMRDQLENITDTRRHQTLSVLGRKVTSLTVLQQQYDEANQDETEVEGRRPRNMSVSNLRMSIKHRHEDAGNNTPSSGLTPDSSTDEWMVNADGQVTGANLETLVENLTLHKKAPELKIWSTSVRLPVQLRVCNVIKIWLETYFSHDFDMCIKSLVFDFIEKDIKKVHPSSANRLREHANRTSSYTSESRAALQKSASGSHISLSSGSSLFSGLTLFEEHSEVSSFNTQLPPSVITRSLRNILRKTPSESLLQSVHVNDFDPLELARQLTLMENSLFCKIRHNEMIGQEFKKKGAVSTAANVKAMIQKSTQVTSWISDSILRDSDPKKRSHIIKFWIKVGDFCLQLSNYNTLMAIRSALSSTSISRLKKTWEYVSGKYKTMYEQIYRATDSQRNFAEYRQRLTASIAPCLPFLGVYLTDMTFIDDGNSNHRTSPNGTQLINFDKYIKTTRVLSAIDQFQIPYRLALVEEIQLYLKHSLENVEIDDQAFYSRSLQIEPREEELDIRSVVSVLAGTDR
ncbi:ras guanine nucleotide exchange factor domain-containing protein [Phycomyces blakesleeanus]